MQNKVLSNLGLATKAGAALSGTDMVIDALREGKVYLIFLANDASDNTKKKINDKAKYYNCEVLQEFSSQELSYACGKTGRMVIGITNQNFVKILKK